MKKKLTLVLTHEKWDKPITHDHVVSTPSMSKLMRNLNLTGKQLCQLRAYGTTAWKDSKGVVHQLSMSDVPDESESPPERNSTNPIFSKIEDKSCPLRLQMQPSQHPQLRLKPAK